MRGPSIQKTAAVSLLLHLTILVLAVVLINYSKNVVMPSPYTVSLVSPSKGRSSGESAQKAAEPKSTEVEEAKSPEESKEVTKTEKKADEKDLNNKLASLKAKADAIDKIARNKVLRKEIAEISVKAGGTKSIAKPSEKEGAAGGSKAALFDSYYAKITGEIRQEWIYPDMGKKQLEAVVSVLIRRDGTITVQGIEKSSGDLLFDRSALKAVTKASPVTPPPYEMEIGIRFYP
jgi:colicin import membrane protein